MTNEQALKLAIKKYGIKSRLIFDTGPVQRKLKELPFCIGEAKSGIYGYGNSWEEAFKDCERDKR
jgi:hypothetical protein